MGLADEQLPLENSAAGEGESATKEIASDGESGQRPIPQNEPSESNP